MTPTTEPTDYVWNDLYRHAAELYRDTPQAALEARILAVFKERPALVKDGIDHVAERFQAGLVRSPWGMLATHVERRAADGDRSTRATDAPDRDRAIAHVERWLRSTGLHFDREPEVKDELFGDRGALRFWAGDEALVERIVTFWQELRPAGQRVEREAEQRQRAAGDALRRLRPRQRIPLRALEPVGESPAPAPANPFLTAAEATP